MLRKCLLLKKLLCLYFYCFCFIEQYIQKASEWDLKLVLISCAFLQQRVFDDLLTNTAPGLLQDLEKFLGNKNWLVGESVSVPTLPTSSHFLKELPI